MVDPQTGRRLKCTFPREQVARCLLNWAKAEGRVNLELFTVEKELQPGESLTLQQVWSVTGVR